MHFTKESDIKTIMMKDYERKNALLKKWHNMLEGGKRCVLSTRAIAPPRTPH